MARLEYEAQVKIEDNVNPLVNQGALWKAGDIVNVHPKGWVWSRMEVLHFLIVNLGFLAESEAEALKEELMADYEEMNAEGEVIKHKEFIARRRYKLNITTFLADLPDKTVSDIYDRDKEAQPFRQSAIELSNIEDITLRPEIQQKITDRKNDGGAR